jgi:hypothetical protein
VYEESGSGKSGRSDSFVESIVEENVRLTLDNVSIVQSCIKNEVPGIYEKITVKWAEICF